jgi:hypothetical protein
MPVILPEKHHAAWLGETEDGNLKELLIPYPADQMRMWEISPRVNSQFGKEPGQKAYLGECAAPGLSAQLPETEHARLPVRVQFNATFRRAEERPVTTQKTAD